MIEERTKQLFLSKGFTVGTLVHRRVRFMGTDADAIQRTVVFRITMMFTLLNGTFDRTVCLVIHTKKPPFYLVRKDVFLFTLLI